MKYLVLASVLLLSGCAYGTIKTVDCEGKYFSILKDFQGFRVEACGGSGAANISTTDDYVDMIKTLKSLDN